MNRKNRAHALAPTLFVLASGFTSSPVVHAEDSFPFEAEVQSCVAAVNARLDLENAHRVRHLVSDARRTGIGYVLTIETSVFADDGSDAGPKRYEAHCVARGDNDPSTFRIEQIDT